MQIIWFAALLFCTQAAEQEHQRLTRINKSLLKALEVTVGQENAEESLKAAVGGSASACADDESCESYCRPEGQPCCDSTKVFMNPDYSFSCCSVALDWNNGSPKCPLEESVGSTHSTDGKGRWLGNVVYGGIGAVYCGTKFCAHYDLGNCEDARKSLSIDKDPTDLSGCPSGWERITDNYWGTACGKSNMWGTWQHLRLCKPKGSDGPKDACVADCLENEHATCSCCRDKCKWTSHHDECPKKKCGGAEDQVSDVLLPTVSTQTRSMSKKVEEAVGIISVSKLSRSCPGGNWYGTAPFCNGECPSGYNRRDRGHHGSSVQYEYRKFGSGCSTGSKVYCCPS